MHPRGSSRGWRQPKSTGRRCTQLHLAGLVLAQWQADVLQGKGHQVSICTTVLVLTSRLMTERLCMKSCHSVSSKWIGVEYGRWSVSDDSVALLGAVRILAIHVVFCVVVEAPCQHNSPPLHLHCTVRPSSRCMSHAHLQCCRHKFQNTMTESCHACNANCKTESHDC